MIDENEIDSLINQAESTLSNEFKRIDSISLFNQNKVLQAFKKNKVALRHFNPTSGYGYGDDGRDNLYKVFAAVFKCEKAIVSPNILSGTHALTIALFGVLRPKDLLLSISGKPYDTLNDVINGNGIGSLNDFGVEYKEINLLNDDFDYNTIINEVKTHKPKVVYFQRSRGYEWRNALSLDKIDFLCKKLRSCGYDGCIMLDNCYGEFTDFYEPTEFGVDVIIGSLIKNPGGGLAQTGGYIAGKEKYIDMIGNRLTSPSIGLEVGSYAFTYQYMYQGLFMAPHTVAQSLKGSLLFGQVFSELGYETSPSCGEKPGDIIRSIKFKSEQQLVSFINSVQSVSPIDSFVRVEAWDMPGYEEKVIMAAGCFVQGASIELSADAPIKEPYIAYLQGGLTYEHCKIALKEILKNL